MKICLWILRDNESFGIILLLFFSKEFCSLAGYNNFMHYLNEEKFYRDENYYNIVPVFLF